MPATGELEPASPRDAHSESPPLHGTQSSASLGKTPIQSPWHTVVSRRPQRRFTWGSWALNVSSCTRRTSELPRSLSRQPSTRRRGRPSGSLDNHRGRLLPEARPCRVPAPTPTRPPRAGRGAGARSGPHNGIWNTSSACFDHRWPQHARPVHSKHPWCRRGTFRTTFKHATSRRSSNIESDKASDRPNSVLDALRDQAGIPR